MENPLVIQGGMGIGISSWRLAKMVSMEGQLGVVSGTGIDSSFIRLLEKGDIGGHLRRALQSFPDRSIVDKILKKYFRETPLEKGKRYIGRKLPSAKLNKLQEELLVLANYAEVRLAKEGHDGLIGLNLLEKLQVTTLPSLYGAMLAGVDYVIMGAGIPREIPGALDNFAKHESAKLTLSVAGATSADDFYTEFVPKDFFTEEKPPLKRPKFLAIISSNALAMTLKKKANGKVDGFIVEKPTAGGHNAPPRGDLKLNEKGEPIYGDRDIVDLPSLKKLGIPFWMAGGHASSESLTQALADGAEGIQAGTLFALCEESGLHEPLKKRTIEKIMDNGLTILTDARASPTGFPFKVAQIEKTQSDESFAKERPRLCDIGYLRKIYKKEDGKLGYRCASEPEEHYIRKGGDIKETVGRKCLCNALMVNLDLGQIQPNGYVEQPLVTLGDDIHSVKRLINKETMSYSAKDVLKDLMKDL